MKKIITRIFTAIMVAGLFGLAACKKLSSFEYPPSEGTVYEIMTNDATFSNFKIAVDRSGMADMFKGSDEYTFFLPTNNAVVASGYSTAYLQLMTSAEASALVKNHIVAGRVDVKTATGPLTALSGRPITIQFQGGTYYADGSDITGANIATVKSYANVINNTLTWHNTLLDAVKNYQHATALLKLDLSLAAITRASTGSVNFNNLLSGTDGYTFFAPTNAAWTDAGYGTAALINAAPVETLVGILKYHLMTGTKFTTAFDSVGVAAYDANKIYFDRVLNFRTTQFYANGILFGNGGSNIVAKNGVMHLVQRILRAPVAKTTLDQIQGDATLSIFYAALIKASTADPKFNFQAMLSGASSYTVYAVNNTGMIAAGYPTAAAATAAPAADLAKLIKFHIIPKRVNNINQGDNSTINTLLVSTSSTGAAVQNALTFTLTANSPTAYKIKGAGNTVSVTASPANLVTTNGILNVVGTVLTP